MVLELVASTDFERARLASCNKDGKDPEED
jgi:hypothetical protein